MNKHLEIPQLNVGLNFGEDTIPVGRLAMRDHIIYFEYDSGFIERNIEISPYKLPLTPGLSSFNYDLFEGLPGVFNDSLPDGWGRLLFDRYIRSQRMLPSDITPLHRLSHMGNHALGALVYEPDNTPQETQDTINLDQLAGQAQEVLDGEASDVLKHLIALNGSSAGARPKALIGLDQDRKNILHGAQNLPESHTHWIVKFPNSQDGQDAGAIEYIYALMAKNAGITMPDVHLFPAQNSAGYFAIKRFDRNGKKRLHMHTACGLLHSDFRSPALDYEDLITLTGALTRDVREVEKLYRLAVFNVLAHNRDDHSKNFSYLMDSTGKWSLAPAYDLTFSSGPHGEQSTMVIGEAENPSKSHLLKLAEEAGIKKQQATDIIDQTQSSLSEFPKLAKAYGVSDTNIELINERITKTNNH